MATATATSRPTSPRKPAASAHLRVETIIPLAREGVDTAIGRKSLLAKLRADKRAHKNEARVNLVSMLRP